MTSGTRKCAAAAIALGMALASGGAMAAGAASNNAPAGGPLAPATAKSCAGCFAVVDASGGFVRGKGTVSVTHLNTGTYDIRFNKPIGKCAWTATVGVGTFGNSAGPAEVTLAGRSGTNNGIFLQTFDGTGVSTDEPFHLLISC